MHITVHDIVLKEFFLCFQNKVCIKEARKLLEFAEEVIYVPRIYVGKMEQFCRLVVVAEVCPVVLGTFHRLYWSFVSMKNLYS